MNTLKPISAEQVKDRVSLVIVASQSVQLKRRGSSDRYWGCCPFHGERTPSFKIDERGGRDGRFNCFGCGVNGSVIDFVMLRDGLEFPAALALLAAEGGLVAETDEARAAREARQQRAQDARDAERARKHQRDSERASKLWNEAQADASLLRTYFTARLGDRRVAALWDLFQGPPPTLRTHPLVDFWDEANGQRSWRGPAMIALMRKRMEVVDVDGVVTLKSVPTGVHRTWITPDGRKRLDGQKLAKRMLGPFWGAAARFGAPAARMIVGEGIETVLAELSRLALAGQAGDPANPGDGWSAECALSLQNMAGRGDGRFAGKTSDGQPTPTAIPDAENDAWTPPEACTDLVLLGDGDMKRPNDAIALMARAQRRLALDADGKPCRRVRVAWAGGSAESGVDFADLALAEEMGR